MPRLTVFFATALMLTAVSLGGARGQGSGDSETKSPAAEETTPPPGGDQETPVSDEEQTDETQAPAPPVELSCQISERNRVLAARIRRPVEKDSNKAVDRLFIAEFRDCEFSEDGSGSWVLTAELLLRFNQDGEFKDCATFAAGFLVSSFAKDVEIRWPSRKRLINDVMLENLDGGEQDLGNFAVHNYQNDQKVGYDELFLQDYAPSVPDIFWGRAVLFEEGSAGELHLQIDALKKKAMTAKSADPIKLAAQVEVLGASGVCFARTGEPIHDTKEALEFVEIEDVP